MSQYLIGDIHGCYKEFCSLLKLIKFNVKKDILWISGDFVGRGPNSLKVLRLIYKLRKNIFVVLGNHEINLLLSYTHIKKARIDQQLMQIINAPDANNLIQWLRHQPILKIHEKYKLIMVHAGIIPIWNLYSLLNNAQEIEKNLKKKQYKSFLRSIYKNSHIPNNIWHNNLSKNSRLQLSINIFTRIRYCLSESIIDMHHKIEPKKAPSFIKPWFTFHNPIFSEYNIIFGHWSSLGDYPTPKNIYGLDTGCCWGGQLTALQWDNKKFFKVNSVSNY